MLADAFKARFGISLERVFGGEIDRLIQQGLLEWAGEPRALRLSLRGRLLGNAVFRQFVGSEKPADLGI